MRRLSLSVALLLASGFVLAAPCDNIDETVELNACLHEQVGKAEEELERYLDATRRRYADAPDAVVSLEAAQGAWVRFRDSDCLAAYDLWGDGSIRGAELATCLLHHTQRRTHDLWSRYLTAQDNPKGVLAEPPQPGRD
jgi:uncharacterized protein YecT (DUF1311 family)